MPHPRPSLLFFSRDPGPTNQLLAALELLHAKRTPTLDGVQAFLADVAAGRGRPIVFARPPASAAWQQAGVQTRDWSTVVTAGAPAADRDAAIDRLLAAEAVAAVVTGTSDVDEDTDRALWRAARRARIRSHVFMDLQNALPLRFRDRDGSTVYPDWAYVPDTGYAAAMAEAGVPASGIRVIGDLHLARLARLARDVPAASRDRLRAAWGARAGDAVVLFVSECGREMAAHGRSLPYDEVQVLRGLLDDLRHGRGVGGIARDPARVAAVVRPHPRDAAGKYAEAVAAEASVRVTLSAEGSPLEALIAADIVVGMNSQMLREAAAVDRPALSLVGIALPQPRSAA